MDRAPRSINKAFFGAKKLFIGCFQGIWILVATLGIYFIALAMGLPETEVRAMTFVSLITANIFTILTNRSWSASIFQILRTPNKTVKWVAGGALLFIILVLEIPFLQGLFLFSPLSLLQISIAVLAGVSSITWFECYKYRLRNRHESI